MYVSCYLNMLKASKSIFEQVDTRYYTRVIKLDDKLKRYGV